MFDTDAINGVVQNHRPQTTGHEPPTTDHITNRPPPAPTIKTTDHRPNQKFTTDHRPPTTDHRPNKTPTTDQSPRNVAKVRKQQNIHLFSISLVDFCDNFTSNTAVSSRARWRYTECIRLH